MSVGVYIQVPFCQTKCTYCNFHTGVVSPAVYGPYVDAVCREIREYSVLLEAAGVGAAATNRSLASLGMTGKEQVTREVNSSVDTIYVGGGTPSLLEPAALERMLKTVRRACDCNLQEVTLEADPETITGEKPFASPGGAQGKADAWLEAGFNRISLGAQSFSDKELKAAGRMHRREDIYQAARVLREAGFANISLDLICGLPHQTAESWSDSLEQLIALRPEHVSIYLLEVDEGSRLGREVITLGTRYSAPAVPSDAQMADCYELACERLAAAGYEHYEISNWALETNSRASNPPFQNAKGRGTRANNRSRHNLKYWKREPYFGFGAGAHSFNGSERWANVHDPAAYVTSIEQGRLPIEQHERLTSQQALDEELFLGLRLLEGIDAARIERAYDVSLLPRLASLRDAGWLEMEGSTARLARGRLAVSNEVFVELMG
ncbi:MAG: coproporphyrinogen-III oxidase family protein [Candidatus Acidiferrales bacterium]